jgi:hypothetical protein
MNITPAMAAKWLANGAKNRNLCQAYAKRLAQGMIAGEWKINGEAIKFDKQGRLIDGQHRLAAIVLSGLTIASMVHTGLADDSFDTIDCGRRRTVADLLARDGVKSYTRVASAVAWVYRHDCGCIASTDLSPRHPQAMEFIAKNPTIVDSVRFIRQHGVERVVAAGLSGALHFIFSRICPQDADLFFERLGTGENISQASTQTSGIYWLRERMQRYLESGDPNGKPRPRREVQPALIIKAWNAMRQRRRIGTLKFSGNEEFPTPI